MTRSTDTAPEILKQDRLGRVKTPAGRREAILDGFERSGMNGAAFAGYIGMKYQALASRVQRRRRGWRASAAGEASPGDAPVRWVEALPGGRCAAGGAPWRGEDGGGRPSGGGAGARYPGEACGGAGMLSFTGSLKVFVAVEPCDMRKGFPGLLALVGERLGEDVRGGALFAFTNRRRTRLKMLYFDGSGLWLLAKRLEKGTFSWPDPAGTGAKKIRLAPEALAMPTGGIDLRGARMRPWCERE